MKKILIIFISIILVILVATAIAYRIDMYRMENELPVIFFSWGYEYTKEPPNLIISDSSNNKYEGLVGTNHWRHSTGTTISDYASAKEREYSNKNTIILNEQTEFKVQNKYAKIEHIRISGETFDKDYEFENKTFILSKLPYGTYYLEVHTHLPQGMVTYNFKIVNEIELKVKTSDNKELKAIYAKVKDNQKKPYLSLVEYEYIVYCYGLEEVNIKIGNVYIPLKDALKDNLTTMEEIIKQCDRDVANEKIPYLLYKDGGSRVYKYDNYTIVQYNTLEGNKDIYIGTPDIDINISKKKNLMIN